jgi:hypothetical protein
MSGARHLIGRRELVALPDLDIPRLRAKVDTGARSSALDVLAYDLWQTADGQMHARLRLALNRKCPNRFRIIETPIVRMIAVRNTGGIRELRPLIETTMRLGPVTKRIRLTVTNRAAMRYRIILGREALCGDFVVDVSKKYVLAETRNPKSEIRNPESE